MSKYNEVIDNMVIGDSFDVDLLVSDVPLGQTLQQAWFTVKKYPTDTDGNAVLQTSITTSATATGQITISGIYTRLLFTLTPAQTRLFNPAAQYAYDIQAITNASKVATIEKGTLYPVQDITITTT